MDEIERRELELLAFMERLHGSWRYLAFSQMLNRVQGATLKWLDDELDLEALDRKEELP